MDRWLASSALELASGEVRIVARKLASGRIEFGLQQREANNTWGDRRLPRVRFFPTAAAVNRWLASSVLALATARPPTTPEPATPEPAAGFVAITAGSAHSCALRSDGTVACWGSNESRGGEHIGQAEAPAGQFTSVTAGNWHSCGLRGDGAVACWGNNNWGQANPPTGQFTAVAAGDVYSCGIRTDGTIACWGLGPSRGTGPPAS